LFTVVAGGQLVVVVVVVVFGVVVVGLGCVVVVGCVDGLVGYVCAKAGRAILTTSPPMEARPRIARELMRLILLGK
jgi:predicted GTPase